MLGYLFRRLLLVVPTLLGIMIVNFAIIQAAPGGPIDVVLAELRGGPVNYAGVKALKRKLLEAAFEQFLGQHFNPETGRALGDAVRRLLA